MDELNLRVLIPDEEGIRNIMLKLDYFNLLRSFLIILCLFWAVDVGSGQKVKQTLTLPIDSQQITPFYTTATVKGVEVSELTLSEPYKNQTNAFNQQETDFFIKGEHFGSSSISQDSHYYEIDHFDYQDHTFKLIIYNKFGESDTLLLNTQLNSYDKQGNLIDAVLLDSRFSYEDIVCFSNFTINPDYSIHIENYVTYLYEEGQYGLPEGLIKDPKPQLYLQMQYKIENGMFKQVVKIEIPTK